MESILINKRVCPIPSHWNTFFELLVKENNDIQISKPLILGAWNFSNDLEKKARFKEHTLLVKHNSNSHNYLISLQENNWHHENE